MVCQGIEEAVGLCLSLLHSTYLHPIYHHAPYHDKRHINNSPASKERIHNSDIQIECSSWLDGGRGTAMFCKEAAEEKEECYKIVVG